MKRKQKFLFMMAALGSVLFHLLIICGAALLVAFSPGLSQRKPEPTKEIKLTITEQPKPTPTPAPPAAPTPPPPRQKADQDILKRMDTHVEQESAEAPVDADFFSNRNTKAATDQTPDPNGRKDRPSQKRNLDKVL